MRPLLLADEVLGVSAAEMQPPSPVAPDAAMVAAYAETVFGYCDGWVAVRALAEKGGPDRAPHTPFMAADRELPAKLVVQAHWAAGAGMALYVIPGAVAAPGEARAEHVVQMQTVLVDLDHGDIGAKREHLRQHLVPPPLRSPPVGLQKRASASSTSIGG